MDYDTSNVTNITTTQPSEDYWSESNDTTTTSSRNDTTISIKYRCYEDSLSSNNDKISKYLMYAAAGWIIFWCFLTIIINIVHKNSGHHRGIHIFQEVTTILLAIFLFILNFVYTDDADICKYITFFNHFFMILLASLFFMESLLASSMVHGTSNKNGILPWPCYYFFPIIIAVIGSIASYLTQKQYYGNSGLHCFAVTTRDMMWGFIIPVWLILALSTGKAQLACISCDKTNGEQDEKQIYWSRRSSKSLVMVGYLIFTIWLMVMFSVNGQKLYLFIITFLTTVVFGPALFVFHTYGHINTCLKWRSSGCVGQWYTMCPEKPKKPKEAENNNESSEKEEKLEPTKGNYEDNKVYPADPGPDNYNEISGQNTPKKYIESPEKTKSSGSPAESPNTKHTNSQKFYSWLTDSDGAQNSGDILFRPTPY